MKFYHRLLNFSKHFKKKNSAEQWLFSKNDININKKEDEQNDITFREHG